MSNVKYCYNMQQANFYMQEGVRCLGVGKHNTTGKMFFIFGFEESKKAYEKWLNRNR